MSERDLWWKIVLVGCLCALGFAAVFPMDQRLKFGIDLYGGYSLLYEIDDTGLSPSERTGLSERVMRVLRERVDPKGVFNLVWRPVGYKRLEIQMPRPSEEITKARSAYERHQEAIKSSHVRRTEVMRALAKSPEERPAALLLLSKGLERRAQLLNEAAKGYDSFQSAQTEWEQRKQETEKQNITREQVEETLQKPAAERSQMFDALTHGVTERRAALDEAAQKWDEMVGARATTQPSTENATGTAASTQPSAEVVTAFRMKERAYQAALAKVLKTNIDPTSLKDGITINTVVEKEDAFNQALAAALASNIDTGRLQAIIDSKPGDAFRNNELKKIEEEFPALTNDIQGMVDASDKLRSRRRGEGRLEDPADLQRLLRGAGVLEFRILAERDNASRDQFDGFIESLKTRGPRPKPGEENYQWFSIENPADFIKSTTLEELNRDFDKIKNNLGVVVERYGDKYYVLSRIGDNYALVHRPGGEDWTLKNASPSRDRRGKPCITFQLDERGGSKFHTLTRSNIEKQLCIFLDDQAVSHATIKDAIRTHGEITGDFSSQYVQEQCKKLNAGSLPRKLKEPPISIRAIGPSLGEVNRNAGLHSAEYGALIVAAFMIIYYFYAGAIAVIAVGMNVLLTLAMMSMIGASVTLAGIAGLVLSIGMGVDANVLINERIREELAKGSAMRMAIKLGYERAFSAILDSNLTTVLTCAILYFLGSEEVKGFGLTLGLGVVINLFTAYFVTRIFFEIASAGRVPMEVSRYPVYAAFIIAGFGAAVFGLGYIWNNELTRPDSVLMLFGKAIVYCGPGILLLVLLMQLFRAIHAGFQKGDRPRMPMLHIIRTPQINWYGARWAFAFCSLILAGAGAFFFMTMDPNQLYDIEFLGGTAAQIDLREGSKLTDEEIRARLAKAGDNLKQLGQMVTSKASVNGSGGNWVIEAPGITASRFEPLIRSELGDKLAQLSPVTYDSPAAQAITVRTSSEANVTLETMKAKLKDLANRFTAAGEAIANAQVQSVEVVGGPGTSNNRSYEIVSREKSKEIVVGAIMDTLQSDLNIQPELTFKLRRAPNGARYFVVAHEDPQALGLSKEEAAGVALQGWKGGVAMVVEDLEPPQPLATLKERLRAMRLQPGFERYGWRESEVFGLRTAPGRPELYTGLMVVVADEAYPIEEGGEVSATWVSELAEPEVSLLDAALRRQASLAQITQFDQQVSGEARRDAQIALVLSWLMIAIYLWFRFGNARWGMGAVLALIHDICICGLFIVIAHWVADSPLGKSLMLEKFRVDLTLVAAFLTIVGYSVNDTIIVYDRIRENKGRSPEVIPGILNQSISQTLSRTIITSLTTFLTVGIMYIFGGIGIRGFNYVMIIGIITGTYSSFAIAGQMLVRGAFFGGRKAYAPASTDRVAVGRA